LCEAADAGPDIDGARDAEAGPEVGFGCGAEVGPVEEQLTNETANRETYLFTAKRRPSRRRLYNPLCRF